MILDTSAPQRIKDVADRLIAQVEKVIIGKRPEIEHAVVAMLCQGHLLIEDVPGIGKTMLAKSSPKTWPRCS